MQQNRTQWYKIIFLVCIVLLLPANIQAQSPTTLLDYGSYLGIGGSDNEAVAVEVSPDDEIIVAINMDANGEIRRYSNDGASLLSSVNVGMTIDDMDVNRSNGDIAVVGSAGLKVYHATSLTEDTSRSKPLGTGAKRVSISTNGVIVMAHGDTVSLWSNTGTLMSQATTEAMTGKTDRHVTDVAISAEDGLVYIVGYRQASADYQSPFLYGYANDLTLSKPTVQMYDYWKSLMEAAQPYALISNSRICRITIGRDGGVYILGETEGAQTAFTTDGSIPSSGNGTDLHYITPIEIDNWNKLSDTNSAVKAFFARINPDTGTVVRGQFILPRLEKDGVAGAGSSTHNYRVENGSIAVDEVGNVYVGGAAGSYIKGRYEGTLTINAEPIGTAPASDSEVAIYVVDSTFKQRKIWTVLTRDQGEGSVTGFATADGIVTFVATSPSGELITTTNAERTTSYNGTTTERGDAYFGVLNADISPQDNDPPVAQDDKAITAIDTPVTITVLANDNDPDGSLDETSVLAFKPTQGDVTINSTNGKITYTPPVQATGTYTFSYLVRDNLTALSNSAVVTVSVVTALEQEYHQITTVEDKALSFDVRTVTQANLKLDTLSILSDPQQGTTSADTTSGRITYTPDGGYQGDDAFVYLVESSSGIWHKVDVDVTVEQAPNYTVHVYLPLVLR